MTTTWRFITIAVGKLPIILSLLFFAQQKHFQFEPPLIIYSYKFYNLFHLVFFNLFVVMPYVKVSKLQKLDFET